MCGMDDIWQSIQQKSEDQSSAETAHVAGIVDAPTREAEVEGEGDHQNQALHGEALVMPFMDKEDYGKKTHNAKDGPAGPCGHSFISRMNHCEVGSRASGQAGQ